MELYRVGQLSHQLALPIQVLHHLELAIRVADKTSAPRAPCVRDKDLGQ